MYLSLFVIIKSHAQQAACVNVLDSVGCVPFTVEVRHCGAADQPTIYVYEGDPQIYTDSSYTFEVPGVYEIMQVVSVGATDSTAAFHDTAYYRSVHVLENGEVEFSLSACTGYEVVVNIDDQTYDYYITEYGDGGIDTLLANEQRSHIYSDTLLKTVTVTGYFLEAECSDTRSRQINPIESLQNPIFKRVIEDVTIDSIFFQLEVLANRNYQINSLTDSTIFHQFKSYSPGDTTMEFQLPHKEACYSIGNYDVCGNEDAGTFVCTSSLEVQAQNNQNMAQWDVDLYLEYGNVLSYELHRNDIGIYFSNVNNDSSFTDENIVCGNTDCYSLVVVADSCDKDSACLTYTYRYSCVNSISEDVPEAINELIAHVEGDEVVLMWDPAQNFVPLYYHIESGGSPDDLSAFDTVLNDNNAVFSYQTGISPVPESCYRIHYIDACNNQTVLNDAGISCSIYLQGLKNNASETVLEWTPFIGFNSPIESYELIWFNGDGEVFKTENMKDALSFIDTNPPEELQDLGYQVCAQSIEGKRACSNIFSLKQKNRLYFPNAIDLTKNDGNNIFKPIGLFVNTYRLIIYDRLGNILFLTEDINTGWDGNYENNPVEPGTYIYSAEYTDLNGKNFTKKGTITVIY